MSLGPVSHGRWAGGRAGGRAGGGGEGGGVGGVGGGETKETAAYHLRAAVSFGGQVLVIEHLAIKT